jgi:hypothetical protein
MPLPVKTRYVEMGPHSTLPDYVIVVVCGARGPYVLRPKGDKFLSLGEAYYDGVMDGGITDQRQKKTFVLV